MKNPTKLCPKCHTEIPEKAITCPHCRGDLRSWWRRHPIRSFIIAMFLLGAFIQALQESDPQYQAEQKKIELQKNEQQEKNLEILSKVDILSKRVYDSYGFEHLGVKIKNNTGKDIDGLTLKASFKNNFGEQVRESISNDKYFRGIYQEVLANGKTEDLEWQLSLFDNATAIDEFAITRIHFTDGTNIEIE